MFFKKCNWYSDLKCIYNQDWETEKIAFFMLIKLDKHMWRMSVFIPNIFFFFFIALSDQPVVDTATATEQAKMLIKSGAISAIKSETKNSGFKRSRMLEIKLKVRLNDIKFSSVKNYLPPYRFLLFFLFVCFHKKS